MFGHHDTWVFNLFLATQGLYQQLSPSTAQLSIFLYRVSLRTCCEMITSTPPEFDGWMSPERDRVVLWGLAAAGGGSVLLGGVDEAPQGGQRPRRLEAAGGEVGAAVAV